MTDREFAAVLIAALLTVAGAAMWLSNRRWRRCRSRYALAHAMRTVTADAPTPSNEDAEDSMMWDAIGRQITASMAAFNPGPFSRDEPPQNLAWPPGLHAVPDRAETERADWALWAAEVTGEEGQP
jgi:hypothetical protein